MKVSKNNSGLVSLHEDTENLSNDLNVLSSPVRVNKSGSNNFGKTAEIVNVRNGNVVVQFLDGGNYGTYSFEQLSNNS